MGADAITDDDLTNLGVKILERYGSSSRGLLVPAASLSLYSALVRDRLSAGFWNEIVGRHEILFIFKLADSTVREVALSEAHLVGDRRAVQLTQWGPDRADLRPAALPLGKSPVWGSDRCVLCPTTLTPSSTMMNRDRPGGSSTGTSHSSRYDRTRDQRQMSSYAAVPVSGMAGRE
jgi:hypothetical protein